MSDTLLAATQEILSSMDADEINSIDDTIEARQVVDAAAATWRDLQAYLDLPQFEQYFELDPTTDVTKPTLMYLPDAVRRVDWIKYDNSEDLSTGATTVRNFREVKPLMRYEFFDRMNSLDTVDTTIYQYSLVIGTGTFDVRGYNNLYPSFYTIINDRTLVFDNYPATVDNTLVSNKTECFGLVVPTFTRADDWVIPLEGNALSLFVNEWKSQAFIELKQVQNAKADERARRALVQLKRTGSRAPTKDSPLHQLPNYGRRSRY